MLRAPVYFELVLLGPDVNGKAKQLGSKSFSARVCARFRAVCPTVAVGTAPFVNLLKQIHGTAAEVLPTATA